MRFLLCLFLLALLAPLGSDGRLSKRGMGMRYRGQEREKELLERNIEMLQMLLYQSGRTNQNHVEDQAQAWLDDFNNELRRRKNKLGLVDWSYNTNITEESQQAMEDDSIDCNDYLLDKHNEVTQYMTHIDTYQSYSLRRQLHLVKDTIIPAPADPQQTSNLTNIGSQMSTIFSTAHIPTADGTRSMNLEPDMLGTIETSRDWDELLRVWTEFRDYIGNSGMRDLYAQYVELNNVAARENGLDDMGAAWQQANYEQTDVEDIADALWEEVKDLYQKLHAYVRHKLSEVYPDKIDSTKGIPAHLLGNMWAQEWQNLADIMMPYPAVPTPDVTSEMQRQNFTEINLFEYAQDYFVNIGLNSMTNIFWEKSMLVKPADGRNVVCHGAASDLMDTNDFRIKMCTEVNQNYFKTVHHEMGHVEYYMQYSHQDTMEREGANAAFHEAVGDTIALMVTTPEHLQKVGLLQSDGSDDSDQEREQRDINNLMSKALEKLPLLPFALVVEKWRYGVFRGDITPAEYNAKWWDLRSQYQGLVPPVERSESNFDPGAKYHIAADVPYIRYFLSFITQFQFLHHVCDKADQLENGMHHCDIYGTERGKEAGTAFGDMLALGRSKPWREVLESFTGETEMKSQYLLEYFKPLDDWLTEYLSDNDIAIGWE